MSISLLTLVFDCVQTLQVSDASVKLRWSCATRRVAMATASRLFVRNSTGLVRSASAVDATIFNAVISAPVGSTIAYSIFFALVAALRRIGRMHQSHGQEYLPMRPKCIGTAEFRTDILLVLLPHRRL